MARIKTNKPDGESNLFTRLLWRVAWFTQVLLWGFLLLFVLHYWLSEVPAVRSYHESGLIRGFDGLAGIVASIDPTWEKVSGGNGSPGISGHPGGNRLTRLQSDATFRVWKELDQMPTWNAGLAGLCFDQQGRLVWAARYPASSQAEPVEYVLEKTGDKTRPVVYSWSDGRSRPEARAGGGAPGQPGAPERSRP